MSRPLLERRLVDIGKRLKRLRADLAVLDEQVLHFKDEADDAQIRALVSESPMDVHSKKDAEKALGAIERGRLEIVSEIERLEARQDELLDQMFG